MKIYSENSNYKLYQGNMLNMLEVIKPSSIDSIITDPPYGLTSITKRFGKEGSAPASTKNNDGSFARLSKGFMGKEWDGSGIEYNIDTWQKCYEVLKPGGYLLAFGGSRTFHRIACAIEDAGFEIRDTIMWLYGSGFPKSMNIGLAIDKKNGVDNRTGNIVKGVGSNNTNSMKNGLTESQEFASEYEERIAQNEWNGWGTALKPSFEPIIIARKPFKGSLVDNVIEYGVGGINIDECRVESSKEDIDKLNKEWDREWNTSYKTFAKNVGGSAGFDYSNARTENKGLSGRFPANTILTYDETDFNEVCGGFPNTKNSKRSSKNNKDTVYTNTYTPPKAIYTENNTYGDSGSASRYFYCAKASKRDRDEGLDLFNQEKVNDGRQTPIDNAFQRGETLRKNTHPTVKPTSLMQYLVRLVTPNGGTVLDPFNGSGSTGKAVMYENKEHNKNYKYIGIELTEEYLPISKARIEYVCNLKEEKESQMSIFDLENNNE